MKYVERKTFLGNYRYVITNSHYALDTIDPVACEMCMWGGGGGGQGDI